MTRAGRCPESSDTSRWTRMDCPHGIHVTTANLTDRAGALSMFDRRRGRPEPGAERAGGWGIHRETLCRGGAEPAGSLGGSDQTKSSPTKCNYCDPGSIAFPVCGRREFHGRDCSGRSGFHSVFPISPYTPSVLSRHPLVVDLGRPLLFAFYTRKGYFVKTWGTLVSNAGISEFRPRSRRLAFRRVSAGPPAPGDRASIAGKDSMSFLNNVDSKVIVAGFRNSRSVRLFCRSSNHLRHPTRCGD